MNKPPAFQFYPDDFIGGTVDMSAQEVGAYVRLLCYQWGRESIPEDRKVCDRIAGCKVTDAVLAKFPNGKNNRIEAEREKQQIWREKSRQGGLHSAANRGSKVVQPPLVPNAQPNANRPVELCLQPNGNIPLSTLQSPLSNTTKKLIRPLSSVVPGTDKATKSTKLKKREQAAAGRIEAALGGLWVNDAGKWVNRVKADVAKAERVVAEVEGAAKEGRIETTAAQYAEQIWKEFQ